MNVANLQISKSSVGDPTAKVPTGTTPVSAPRSEGVAEAKQARLDCFDSDEVGGCMVRDLISLPSWFPAAQASAILRQKQRAFVLVTDRTGLAGVASAESLAAAPTTKSLGWCAKALTQSVSAKLPREQALTLMDIYAVDWLPVVAGASVGAAPSVVRAGVIVGVITRQMASVRTADPAAGAPLELAA